MKKLLATVLCLCMLCATAFADTLVTNGGVALNTGDALDSDILDEMSNTGNEAERNLRNAVSVCLWEEMNRLLIEFAERKTLSDFMQECRNQMSGEWDLYII